MNELERRLKESLTQVRDAGQTGRVNRAAARQEVFRRIQRRRRWNLAGSTALAGAAAVAAFLVFSNFGTRPLDESRLGPAEMYEPALAAIQVGDNPTELSVGGRDYVWSANEGDSTLSRIDPETDAVVATVELPAPPGDVAIGDGPVWVSLPSIGQIVQVDPSRAAISGQAIVLSDEPVEDIELSVGADALWAVVHDDRLFRIPLVERTPLSLDVPSPPTDVAVKEDTTWVLSQDGTVTTLNSATGEGLDSSFVLDSGDDGELTFAGGSLWHLVSGGEMLVRVDAETGGTIKEVDPPGTLLDFVIDPEVAWALSVQDGRHYLTSLDRTTFEIQGDPIQLSGVANELVIEGGSLWIGLADDDVVLRFSKFF